MNWNNKFNYPKSSRSIEDGMRKYLFDDEKLPSVTSILQATKSDEDKAALENIKDPGQIEIATENENVEKFEDHSKQLKN